MIKDLQTAIVFKYEKNGLTSFKDEGVFTSHRREGRLRYREISNRLFVMSFSDPDLRKRMTVKAYGEDEIIIKWLYNTQDNKYIENRHLLSFSHMFFSFRLKDDYTGSQSLIYYLTDQS